jgi:flagellar basal-body rod modification protein FlgD
MADAIAPTAGVANRMDSLGLDLQSLFRIILTQLTYQDPLKPVDNFEFVSQLAQFTALEQSRQVAEKMDNLLLVQASAQAVNLLGRSADVNTGSATVTGTVKAISFQSGNPALTLQTADGEFITGVSPSQIIQVR